MGHTATVHLDWGLFCVTEVPIAQVRPLMPPRIQPLEARLGHGLLTINLAHFLAGGEGIALPQNHEIDIGVAVLPDNAGFGSGPEAATAVHVLDIASTSPDYLAHCEACGYRVHRGTELRFDISEDGLAGQVQDAEGRLLRWAWRGRPPAFGPFRRIGQDVVHDSRGEYRLNYVFSGGALASLVPADLEIELSGHSFFQGILLPRRIAWIEASILRRGEHASTAFHGPEAPQSLG